MFLTKENNKESFRPTPNHVKFWTHGNPNQTSVSHQILDPRKHKSIFRLTQKLTGTNRTFIYTSDSLDVRNYLIHAIDVPRTHVV